MQGAYFYEVFCDVAPIMQAFAKKGTKPVPYAAEPFALTNKEVKERKKREERMRYDKQRAKIAAWAAKTNMQMAGREVKQSE